MFPGTYVSRVLCSPGSMFPGTYVPRVLCSPGPMFPGSYVGGGGGGEHIVANSAIDGGICWHIVTHMNVDIPPPPP